MKRILSFILAAGLAFYVTAGGPVIGQQQTNGNITAASTQCTGTSCVIYSINQSTATVALQVTGTWSGTLQFEGTVSGTESAVPGAPLGGGSSVTSATANGIWLFSVPGLSSVQVRASALASGTAAVRMQSAPGTQSGSTSVTGGNDAASTTGAAVPAKADYVGGSEAGTLRGITVTDNSGKKSLDVNITGGAGAGGTSSSYGAAFPAAGTAAGFNDGTNMQAARVVDCDTGAGTIYCLPVNLVARASGAITEVGTAASPLRVDVTGTTTQPVSGTVTVTDGAGALNVIVDSGTTAATQSGTWTVQPGNTANTTAWLIAGGKTNNNAAPGATNVGALVAVANAAAPTWTEGNLVGLSTDLAGALRVSGGGGGTQYTQDATLTVATTVGTMAMGRASAAAPTDVSADNDAVIPWYLRSGALAMQPTYAGVLATTGNGVAGTGVSRVTLASDSTGNIATIGTSVTPGTAAANLGKAEDAIAASGDTGVAMLGVIQATLTAPAADGDYTVPKLNANGAIWTQSVTIDEAVDAISTNNPVYVGALYETTPTSVSASGDRTSLHTTIDQRVLTVTRSETAPVSTMNSASANNGVTAALSGVFDDTTPTAITENQFGYARMSANRNLYATFRDAAGNERGANVNASNELLVACSTCSGSGVSHIDDAAFTVATDDIVPIGAMFDDVTPDSVNENDAGVVRMSANRNVYSTIRDAAGNERGVNVDAANALLVNPGSLNNFGVVTEDASESAGNFGIQLLTVRRDTAASSAGASADYATLNTDATGNVWTVQTPLQASFTDRSGNVTSGGTSQTLAASNASRKRIVIENFCNATTQNIAAAESLFVNFTTAASTSAGTSIEIAPCGSYDSGFGPVSTEAITVTAATTAHRWAAKEQ